MRRYSRRLGDLLEFGQPASQLVTQSGIAPLIRVGPALPIRGRKVAMLLPHRITRNGASARVDTAAWHSLVSGLTTFPREAQTSDQAFLAAD